MDDSGMDIERVRNRFSSWMGRGAVLPIVVVLCIIVFAMIISGAYSIVPKGEYEVKQTWGTGTVDARMEPGFWLTFGSVERWPKAETFYFTADVREGKREDESIEVRFNDGSLCNVSGTCRIVLPKTKDEAMALVVDRGYKDFHDLELKLILPVVRNALRATANLMSARESYSEKRLDFINGAWDQIQFGLYETTEVSKEVKDPITGDIVVKKTKVVKKDKDGNPVRQRNPLSGTGIMLDNFEVKQFVYAPEVKKQIATQQQAYMAVETARANAARAEQDALTVEAQGKARVMGARYAAEQEKIRAVVKANKEKEVAEIAAKRKLEVARLDRLAAEQQKQAAISIAQGEAEARRLKLQADNYAAMKIKAWETAQANWAQAFAQRKVPTMILGSKGGADSDVLSMRRLVDIALGTKILGIDLNLQTQPGSAPAVPGPALKQLPAAKLPARK